MSLNRWRLISYTDDGCSAYQCLSCYKSWESRTNPSGLYSGPEYAWQYCPYCGCQWEGQHECRERDYPAWAYNRGIDYYGVRHPRPREVSQWRIEKKCVIDGAVHRDWDLYNTDRRTGDIRNWERDRRLVLDWLRTERKLEADSIRKLDMGVRDYYRIRLGNNIACEPDEKDISDVKESA